jgi:diamine N-acetyltransferase
MGEKLLTSSLVYLRPVETSDAHQLLLWENDPENWHVTDTEVPFSLSGIMQLIEQQQNFRSFGQLRFIICLQESNKSIGTIDLYDADFKNGNVAIGVLIAEKEHRGQGIAYQSLQLVTEYAREVFNFVNVTCSIHASNVNSISLFEKAGFVKVGTRRNWYKLGKERTDEIIYQLCLEKI